MTVLNHLQFTQLTFPNRPGLVLSIFDFIKPQVERAKIDCTRITDPYRRNLPGGLMSVGKLILTVGMDPDNWPPLGQADEPVILTFVDGQVIRSVGFFCDIGGWKGADAQRAEDSVGFCCNQDLNLGQITAPTVSLAGAVATLSHGTPGVVIRYTTDGSPPNSGSTVYSSPVTLTGGQTIIAIGQLAGWIDSPTASATYTVGTVLGYVALNGTANGDRPYYISASGLVQLDATQWPNPVVAGQSGSQDAVFAKRPDGKMATFIGSAFDSAGLYAAKSDISYIANYSLIATDTAVQKMEGDLFTTFAATYRYTLDEAHYRMTISGGPPNVSAIAHCVDGGDTFTTTVATTALAGYSGGNFFLIGDGGMLMYGTTDAGGGGLFARVSYDKGVTIAAFTLPGASTGVVGGATWNTATDYLCLSISIYSGSYGNDTVYTSPKGTISWVSRQTFVSIPGSHADKGQMSTVDNYTYYAVKLTSGGWTIHRAPKDIFSFTAWAATTAYTVGQSRTNSGNIYIVTTAGTSAGSGGPTGTASSITDGSVVWAYHGPSTTMFMPVHAVGGTAAKPGKVKKSSITGHLFYQYNQQLYRSTDGGATFAALGSAVSKTGNQIAII